jgi:hypothetical protein
LNRRLAWLRNVLVVSWLGMTIAGSTILLVHSQAAGRQADVISRLPDACQIPLDSSRNTIIHFLHPKCPCSIASIDEFSRLLAHCGDRIDAWIVIVHPPAAPPDWENTFLANFCRTLPGVHVLTDQNGVEAQRCQAMTSGQTYLVKPNRDIIFRGGITSRRGHSGQSVGRTAIQELVAGGNPGLQATPVYGCSF